MLLFCGFRVLGFGLWVLGFGLWLLGFGFWVLGVGFCFLCFLDFKVLGFGPLKPWRRLAPINTPLEAPATSGRARLVPARSGSPSGGLPAGAH